MDKKKIYRLIACLIMIMDIILLMIVLVGFVFFSEIIDDGKTVCYDRAYKEIIGLECKSERVKLYGINVEYFDNFAILILLSLFPYFLFYSKSI